MMKSTFGNQKFIFCSLFSVLCFVFLSGCAGLEEYSQKQNILSAISRGKLKGMAKVDLIKEFGQPVATSKSEISECWYYARPKSVWVWFKNNKVDHWEVE